MARGLGKGLQDLLQAKEEEVREVSVKELRPNPYQPRKVFDQKAIDELKDSVQEHGILQPILVRKSIKGYEIILGERRFRAASAAGLKTVPVIIKDYSEEKMMEVALIENLQREDLNPVEEAQAYQKLMDHLKLTQEELASRVGKSRPHIANHIRLLQLPKPVLELLSNGMITMGHGRALLGLKKKSKMEQVVQRIKEDGLNVRQLEKLIQDINMNVSRGTKKKTVEKNVFFKEKESYLRDRFGTSVSIKKSKRKGKIEIEFFSQDDLERILDLLEK
ncbi:ParB/RepB/Spo0J family partition protein [Fictibacillus phosphorivorans]|uniref:ParB/RepB/Spo0J family partition protein n=1 Tax=Fictibacillus phosphorivorans TaxID=1221500 RepID=UPI00203D7513|nr:ParB/RepB/Spo0J family partition protein [Fictibacillus phosphorivorans]MCM3720125.1 ParB/RepB/Spo0J family partition protein [Fictibacillus phosphorivorans]MCM3777811.1 ParB/RepB/Spo0J family partition protein [Fictibacillus phosphorivorans]